MPSLEIQPGLATQGMSGVTLVTCRGEPVAAMTPTLCTP